MNFDVNHLNAATGGFRGVTFVIGTWVPIDPGILSGTVGTNAYGPDPVQG